MVASAAQRSLRWRVAAGASPTSTIACTAASQAADQVRALGRRRLQTARAQRAVKSDGPWCLNTAPTKGGSELAWRCAIGRHALRYANAIALEPSSCCSFATASMQLCQPCTARLRRAMSMRAGANQACFTCASCVESSAACRSPRSSATLACPRSAYMQIEVLSAVICRDRGWTLRAQAAGLHCSVHVLGGGIAPRGSSAAGRTRC